MAVGDSQHAAPERSPDNIAPMCAFLASEKSDWLTGRTLAVSGYTVGLYNNPATIAEITSDGPWTLPDLESKMVSTIKPLADGLPYVAFAAAQRDSAGT
jgi:hypothetical protein